MAELPIVSGSEIQTPAGGPSINPQALREAALAPGKVADALGSGLGEVFQDVANRVQDARNSKAVFTADLAMRQAKDTFLNDIATDPKLASDPATWVPEVQKRVQDTQEKILSDPTLAPVVKRHLEEVTGMWGMSTTSEVRTNALRRERADTQQVLETTIAKSIADSHPNDGGQGAATAIASIKEMNRLGLIGPKVAEQKIALVPEQVTKAQINWMMTNPETASNVVELAKPLLEKLTTDDKNKLRGSLYRAQHEQRNENYDNLMVELIDPQTGQISATADAQKRVTDAMEQKLIDPVRGKAFLAGQNRQNEADDKKISEAIHAGAHDVEAWTSAKDEAGGFSSYAAELRAKAAKIKNPVLQQKATNEIDKQLQSMKKQAKLELSPEATQMYERMKEDRLHLSAFAPLAWGGENGTQLVRTDKTLEEIRNMDPKEIEKTFGKGWTKQAVISVEQGNFDKKWAKMRDWFSGEAEAGRKPSVEQADAARQQIEFPSVQAAVVHSMKGGASGSVRVRSKDGQTGTIPAANLQRAIAAGYTQIQ